MVKILLFTEVLESLLNLLRKLKNLKILLFDKEN